MIYVDSGAIFTATVEGAPVGLVGQIGVRIEDGNNVVISARTTTGIVESAPGIYAKDDLHAPLAGGTYLVIWDYPTGDPPPDDFAAAEEELEVNFQPQPSPPSGFGGLPFSDAGTVYDRSGAQLADIACRVWRVQPARAGNTGEIRDYGGVAEYAARSVLVGKRNLRLTVNGQSYNIVDAIQHDGLPSVELLLKQVAADG